MRRLTRRYTLHPTPFTLLHTPYTLHPGGVGGEQAIGQVVAGAKFGTKGAVGEEMQGCEVWNPQASNLQPSAINPQPGKRRQGATDAEL